MGDDFVVSCQYCERKGSTHRRCSRCKSVYYCTKVCQNLDWPRHKGTCATSPQRAYPSKETESKMKANRRQGQESEPEEVEINKKTFEDEYHNSESKCAGTFLKALESANTNEKAIVDGTYEHQSQTTYSSLNCYSSTCETKADQSGGRKVSKVDNNDFGDDSKTDSDTAAGSKENDTAGDIKLNDTENVNNAGLGKKRCGFCASAGCLKKCSRCKQTFYCSGDCQRNDWPSHKHKCKKKLSEEEEIILEAALMRIQDSNGGPAVLNFDDLIDHLVQTLTTEYTLKRARRPEGSLARAKMKARKCFPYYNIVTCFEDIPPEPPFTPYPFMVPPRGGNLLVAFMCRYHDHEMGHGVYLKDARDRESKVYFDPDITIPNRYFSYSQVKPGGYICLLDPVMHEFMDGTVGIRIDNPYDVRVL